MWIVFFLFCFFKDFILRAHKAAYVYYRFVHTKRMTIFHLNANPHFFLCHHFSHSQALCFVVGNAAFSMFRKKAFCLPMHIQLFIYSLSACFSPHFLFFSFLSLSIETHTCNIQSFSRLFALICGFYSLRCVCITYLYTIGLFVFSISHKSAWGNVYINEWYSYNAHGSEK